MNMTPGPSAAERAPALIAQMVAYYTALLHEKAAQLVDAQHIIGQLERTNLDLTAERNRLSDALHTHIAENMKTMDPYLELQATVGQILQAHRDGVFCEDDFATLQGAFKACDEECDEDSLPDTGGPVDR